MNAFTKTRRWLRALFRKGEAERELDAEVRFHLERQIEQNLKAGMMPEDARLAALRTFGGVEQIKEECRDARGVRLIQDLLQDIRYEGRMLRRSPAFTAVALLTLALGIGANTAIFSVVNGVLLRPLPYQDPDRLVQIWGTNPSEGLLQMCVSVADLPQVKSQNRVFADLAVYRQWEVTLTGAGEPDVVPVARVSPELFSLLGVQPVVGRGFLLQEDQPGSNQVVILSHALWERHFGSDPNAIGKSTILDDKPYTVVGIMPPGFEFPDPRVNVWLPLALDKEELKSHNREDYMVGRLKPGADLKQAQTELNTIASRLARLHPSDTGWSFRVVPLLEQVVGKIRPALLLLLGAVGFVLMIACANVADLSLARGAARRREIAIRETLGAGRGRVIRQLLTESLLIAFVGGALGLALAPSGIHLLRALAPSDVPRLSEIGIDRWVLAFTFSLSALTAVLFGLAPAMRISGPDLNVSLKEGGMTSPMALGVYPRHRARSFLVSLEVAMALVLLAGAGLLLNSFWRLMTVNLGFDPHNVLTMELGLPSPRYPTDQSQIAFFQRVLAQAAALPGVQAAALTNQSPLEGGFITINFTLEGRPPIRPDQAPQAQIQIVSPGYFRMLRIPLLQGRYFTEQDGEEALGAVIINRAFARQFFPGEDPLGKRLKVSWGRSRGGEIVGVVGDTRDEAPGSEPQPKIYQPFLQAPGGYMKLLVQTAVDPWRLARGVQNAIWSVDRTQAVAGLRTIEEDFRRSVAEPRFRTLLVGTFAGLALALAFVGIYGVMAYTVTQRTHEFAIRMALGAERGDVLKLVVGQGLLLTLIGLGAGLAAALILTRFLVSFLYEVRPADPTTFAAVANVLIGGALLASYLPARRATKVDPMVALRYE